MSSSLPIRLPRVRWILVLLITVLCVATLATVVVSQGDRSITFGYGPGMQMVDPNGRHGVPIWMPPGDTTVDFALYALTDRELISRYHVADWGESVDYDVDGLPRVHSWQQSFAAVDPYAAQFAAFPDVMADGFYILEATLDGQRATIAVNVGETMLLARRGVDGVLLLWAAQLQTGAPVADMTITVYDAAGMILTSGVTGADGRVHFASVSGTPYFAVGHSEGESAVVGLMSEWRSQANGWWAPDTWTPDAQRAYLYTDRPIYRPGQVINYNAVLRAIAADGYAPLAPDKVVTVRLYDARNNLVATQTPAVDAMGTVHGDFLLADEPPLGTYRLDLTTDSMAVSQTLDVQAYTKPEYQVQVETPATSAIAGDVLPITVAADYFFGRPVAGAAVKLQIYRTPQYGYYWEDFWWPGPGGWETLVREETGTTDADGRWTLDYALPADEEGANWTYRIVATVTDARNRPIEGSAGMAVFWSDMQVEVSTPRYGYAAGTPVEMTVRARDRAGAPLPGREVTVRFVRDWEESVPVLTRTVTTDAQGDAVFTVDELTLGWYRVIAAGVDDRGRVSRAESYLWIYGAGEDWWWTTEETVTLSLDKTAYIPGETATLLIQSRVAGTGLLTVQRDTLITERVVTIDGPVTAVDLPVTEAMAPNAHITFHIFQPTAADATFRREGSLVVGRTELRATSSSHVLDVGIAADKTDYTPGELARLTITLTDHQGRPQAGRVSVAVVDEAIFALAEDRSGSIVDAFYAPQPDRTTLYDSLVRSPENYYGFPEVDEETPPPLPTPTTEPRDPDSGLSADGIQVRRVFLDTAYWNATVDVGAAGVVSVDVPLPDNLTTWRVIVKAVTDTTKVGEARGALLVTQEIIARPALPRFAVLGDHFIAGVVGQNYTGAPTAGTATIAGAGLQLLDGEARTLEIADGDSATAAWNVVAATVGTSPVQMILATDAGGDAVELPLPVKPFAVPERTVMAGQANPQAVRQFTLPLNAVNDATALTVRLTPSLALGVLDGLDELIDYPYGCVEQTMSRVLPTAVAAQVYADLGLANPKADELPTIVSQGLQRLYGFQQENGGWGWFFDDDGGIYTTAYVLFGLTAVEQSGFAVDEAVLARGFDFLTLRYPDMSHAGMQAFVQYVLAYAGRGDLGAVRALAARQDELDAAGLATLALAFDHMGWGDEAQPLVDKLLAQAHESSITAYWPAVESWDEYHWRMMTSDDKNTGLAVAALSRLRADDARLPKAVRWLMEHRRGAGWSNTQSTAFAVLGLLDYIKLSGELAVDYAYRVELNGETLLDARITPENVTTPIAPLVIPGTALAPGTNTLAIVRDDGATGSAVELTDGFAPLYFTAVLDQQLYFDAFTPVSSAGGGIKVTRRYDLLEGTPRADGAYNIGDVVQVTLEVELSEEMAYVMVQDPIPAGFDVISERENAFAWSEFGVPFFWRDWGYNRKEVRDDRVDFFITDGWPGPHTLTYTMRATLAGEFSVLPTSVFPMYADHFWGRSASNLVTVAPDQLGVRPALAGDMDHSCTVTDFDVQLVAAAWPNSVPTRDVVADGVIDLRDVAVVAGRRGAACTADLPMHDTTGATIAVALAAPDTPQVIGRPFMVEIRQRDAIALHGLALQLAYDPGVVRPVRIAWATHTTLPLGPVINQAQGRLLFGSYELGATVAADGVIARVFFAGLRAGTADISVVAGQAADSIGRIHGTEAQTGATVTIGGEQSFLPMIQGD